MSREGYLLVSNDILDFWVVLLSTPSSERYDDTLRYFEIIKDTHLSSIQFIYKDFHNNRQVTKHRNNRTHRENPPMPLALPVVEKQVS